MSIELKEDRPPYVRFERRELEDRTKTLAAGHYVARDVDYAIITPQGSKDQIPRQVDEWFQYLGEQVQQERMNPLWLQGWKEAYKMFKNGQDIPLNGTPIKTWSVLSPAQIKQVIECNILTIEDLAQANDESLNRLGMGANMLKKRAQDWVAQANGPGKVSQEMAQLREENAGLKLRGEAMQEQLNAVTARLNALEPPQKRPEPSKGAAATAGALM
jgi:hypothetical protein